MCQNISLQLSKVVMLNLFSWKISVNKTKKNLQIKIQTRIKDSKNFDNNRNDKINHIMQNV
ncbi:hypothetical protein DW776_12415 [Ruminococcus sp. AM30-15AC]|jgi:hypothetical protein|nr:hypothetical protein DWV90_06765 [Ruminococcus sp. AF13-37]RGW23435.1 hypothetical protein DWV87_05945 [Ruminococcus sp. AF13-28]RHD92018.1 hypothetical protein DW776_12415 [Ruminococcus sp. AM30-15AC]RHG58748.1 hypothetical protein DW253_01455 [Ruminococcus sp. AM22-13]RHQ67639.1 hypothetical protein DWY28_00265 [Ruminococcus sp. AF24-32LB]